MPICLIDKDPRAQSDPNYPNNPGSFGVVAINLNKVLGKLRQYTPPDKADWVGICDGLDFSFKYKDKRPFLLHVWEASALSFQHLALYEKYKPKLLGLSRQVTDLWAKYGIICPTVYAGCDTNFWKPTKPKNEVFTFLHVGFSNVRSGLDLTLKAYHTIFKNRFDVQLIIKNTSDSARLADIIKDYQAAGSNIVYINERLDNSALRDLYSAAHVCLYMTRAASFGLPLLEASACGCYTLTGDVAPNNELIKPGFGALLRPNNQVPIEFVAPDLEQYWGLTNCYPMEFCYGDSPLFWDFSVDKYAEKLYDVYENWDNLKAVDTRAPVVNEWGWDKSASQLINALG